MIAYIDDQGLLPGDSLPSTAALSKHFAVSRPVIREALSSLAALGLIEVSNGRNAVVKPLDDQLITLYLSRAIRATRRPLTALMEVRGPLEIEAAFLAAERSTAEERENLRTLETRMADVLGNGDAYINLDLALHRQIAVLGRNPALLGITDALRGHIFSAMTAIRTHRELRNLVGHEHAEHQQIISHIIAGSPERASDAMRDHMATTQSLINDVEDVQGASGSTASHR